MTRRDLLIGLAVFFAAVLASFTIGLTISVYHLSHNNRTLVARIAHDEKTLGAIVKSPNHIKNIAVWCNAINAGRDYSRTRAMRQHQRDPLDFPPYQLPDLNCKALEAGTAASLNPH